MADAEKTAVLKADVYKKAHNALLLCLDNKVLKESNKEDSAAGKLSEHIDEFNKLIGDLANIDVDIDDDDHPLMLLTSLPSLYDNFVETLFYGKESFALEYVFFILISRELKKRSYAKDDGDGLFDHVKKDCPKWNKQKSTSFVKKNAGHGSRMHSDGNDNGDLLMAVSEEMFLESSMDSGGSYHMTPTKDILFNYKEFNSCTISLSDNRACAIGGQGR
ncbi:hypothetical protein Tco_0389470 [Tanacetum coccineum]